MGCCIELETPQSIKEEDDVDVFAEIMQSVGWTETRRTKCAGYLWARFRYTGIGSTDRSYWIQCMKDRLGFIAGRYAEKLDVFDAYLQTDYTDLSDGATEVVYEHEDTPSTAVSAGRYLATRDTTKAKSFSGLPATTVKDDLDAIQDPYTDFALEFSGLFCRVLT